MGFAYSYEYVQKYNKFEKNIRELADRLEKITPRIKLVPSSITGGMRSLLYFTEYTFKSQPTLFWTIPITEIKKVVKGLEKLADTELEACIDKLIEMTKKNSDNHRYFWLPRKYETLRRQ